MSDPIEILIEVADPIYLAGSNVSPTEEGLPAGGTTDQILSKNSNDDFDAIWRDESANGTVLEGAKSSASDEGTIGQMSFTDDYIYFCVQTGIAGSAIWKRAVVFQT